MDVRAIIGYSLLAIAGMNLCLGVFLVSRGRRKAQLPKLAAVLALTSATYAAVMGLAYVRASLGLEWDMYYRSAWVGWLGLAPLLQITFVLRGQPRAARAWGA